MPLQLIASEGTFNATAEKAVFKELTALLLELNGLTGNAFMTPNVIGEITIVPADRTFSGGSPAPIVILELKVPSIVLPTRELQLDWIAKATDILVEHSSSQISKKQVWANVTHAIDGLWGIAGHAYTNEELGQALSGVQVA